MNETDQEASTRAIDSLLNYETVKYFGNEQYEAIAFDQALARYERASVASKSSLSLLNIGQATIIGAGLAVLMLMAGRGVIARHADGRRLRAREHVLDPALHPAELPGLRVSRDQAVADRHGVDVPAARA